MLLLPTYGHGEDDGGVVLGRDAVQCLQVAQLEIIQGQYNDGGEYDGEQNGDEQYDNDCKYDTVQRLKVAQLKIIIITGQYDDQYDGGEDSGHLQCLRTLLDDTCCFFQCCRSL